MSWVARSPSGKGSGQTENAMVAPCCLGDPFLRPPSIEKEVGKLPFGRDPLKGHVDGREYVDYHRREDHLNLEGRFDEAVETHWNSCKRFKKCGLL